MPNPEGYLAQADEAERMAAVVSYGRDREALMRQAAAWRAQAAALEGEEPAAAADPPPPEAASWLARCARALFGRRRTRGG